LTSTLTRFSTASCSLGRLLVALGFTIVTVSGLVSALTTDHVHAAERKTLLWMFHRGPGVAAVAADAEASRFLDDTRPYVLKKRGDAFVIPPNWHATPSTPFQSFGAIKAALEQHTLAPDVKGVLYDYEKWSFTPEEEQRNPPGYVQQAADLVHAHDLLFLTSPSANLVKVMAPETGKGDADLFSAYLRLGIAADGARYADVFVIQAQRALRNTEVFANFVQQAASQARRANPKVVVLAGISTNPIGRHVITDDILRAIAATRDIVDGYWLNIPTRNEYSPGITEYRPDIAIEVLHRLAEQ